MPELYKILKTQNLTQHFKLLQFPLNLFEKEALMSINGKSLIEFAKENEMYCFTQRPLNVIAQGKVKILSTTPSNLAIKGWFSFLPIYFLFLRLKNR